MSLWVKSVLLKAFFLKGFKGAFTASEYDKLEEDELDVLMLYLTESGGTEETSEKMFGIG